MGVPLQPTGTESNKICDLEQISRRPLLKPGLSGRLWRVVCSQKKHVQNLSVLVCVNFLVAGLGFITKVKIANTLGKAEFGLFAYGIAIASYGAAIIGFGLNRTLVRDLIHFPKRQGQLVVSSLLLRGFMFLVVTLALLIWKYFSPAVSDLTWGVVLLIFGQSMLGLELKAVYDSWGKMSRHAVYNLIQRCVYFAAVWLMIMLSPRSLSVFWLGIFTISAVIFYMILQCKWAFNRIDFGGISRSMYSATLGLARGNLIIWFSTLGCLSFGIINQIILKFYEGKESLGGYAAAWQIVTIAMLFLNQVARIGNPATARITKPGIEKTSRIKFLIKYSTVMFLVVFPVCLATIIFPEMILRLIYKPEYASSAGVLRIMGIYMIIYSLGFVASQYIISARMEKLYFTSVIIGGVLSILFCILLIPKSGGMGAAISLLIAHGISMGLYWVAMILHVRNRE
ncbi:MAG: oligosaccharide flippase family protein [Phycisphaerae bacterium]|nr:oligosaccharide flippase family protein [Phycisphaerae bacterium]